MLIRFWGVRGSLSAPLLPSQIKSKILAILEQVTPDDVADAESRQRFIDGLPPWLYGTPGGNTPCVSVDLEGLNEPVVFDCGSGIRELGLHSCGLKPMPQKYHIFLSHFHWDHLQGLPFFNPAYIPAVSLNFYSLEPELEKFLSAQMHKPYFPVEMKNMASQKEFLQVKAPLAIGDAVISFKKMNHPGDSHSFKVSQNGKHFIYATDTELTVADFLINEDNSQFFRDADIIVLDSQYTLGESVDKDNWGHSAFNVSVDFAANWGIKHLVLFHHDPAYDDEKLYGILQSARLYLQHLNVKGMEISLATEGQELLL